MTVLSDHKVFSPTRVSPSRLNAYSSCGVEFRMRYLEGISSQMQNSASLFGFVMHDALSFWGPDRSRDLRKLVDQAWDRQGSPLTKRFIVEYRKLSGDARALEAQIRLDWQAAGKESKKPRATKEWKESSVADALNSLMEKWIPAMDAEGHFRFEQGDPLPMLYDESLALAEAYSARWRHLPGALTTEFHVMEPWRGFFLDLYIDTIEPLMVRGTGEMLGYLINDYKTYKVPPSEMKDYRQIVMYYAAVVSMVQRGALPYLEGQKLYVGIDYVRWTDSWVDDAGQPFPSRRVWEVMDDDLDRLEGELLSYKRAVEGGIFLPADKNRNPIFCDYPDDCCLKSTTSAGGSMRRVEVEQ